MAYLITEQCTACAACVQICPNHAIAETASRYAINPYFCVECLGYAEAPQCAELCPVDAIQPEPV